jgi:DHA3 family macrolide efflux protein-like MFS transporter
VQNKRDIRRVVAARFISRAGGEAAFFVGIWGKAAYVFHADPTQLALLMGTLALSTILGTLVSGVLIDRYDPRRVLIAAEAIFVPVALMMMLPTTMWQLTGMVGLLGFFGAPVMTAVASFAPFLAEDRNGLERINAWIEGAGSTSFVIGPALGALIARFASLDWIFVLDAATSLVAVVLVARVTMRQPAARAEKRGAIGELKDGLRFTYGSRPLRYYVLMGTAAWLGFGAFGALEPLFYRDVLNTGVETIGWVNTVFGIGLVTGAALLARLPRRVVSARGLAFFSVLMGLGALLYVGTRDLRVVVLGAVAWGVIIGAVDPLLRTLIQSDSPDEYVGRVAGVSQMHRQAGELLPLAFAPALAGAFGVQAVLIGGGLVLSVVALASLGEAFAVDRGIRERRDIRISITTADEPISPNP